MVETQLHYYLFYSVLSTMTDSRLFQVNRWSRCFQREINHSSSIALLLFKLKIVKKLYFIFLGNHLNQWLTWNNILGSVCKYCPQIGSLIYKTISKLLPFYQIRYYWWPLIMTWSFLPLLRSLVLWAGCSSQNFTRFCRLKKLTVLELLLNWSKFIVVWPAAFKT